MATFDELRARDLAALFQVGFGDALAHLGGVLQLTVSAEEITAATFFDSIDAEAAHAILSKQRVFALRTVEALGSRLWIRWQEPADSELVRLRLGQWLRGLSFRVAAGGKTIAPLYGGGRVFGPDGKPGSFAPGRFPRTSLATLARRLAPQQSA